MGLFSKKVTEQELRDYRRGKPVRPEVAAEATRRGWNNSGKKAARAIRAGQRRRGR